MLNHLRYENGSIIESFRCQKGENDKLKSSKADTIEGASKKQKKKMKTKRKEK